MALSFYCSCPKCYIIFPTFLSLLLTSMRGFYVMVHVTVSRAISEQKVKMKRLGTDLTTAQKDMKAKHKAYENAVGILSRRLQEALGDKETAEAELVKLKAQLTEGGNNQALQVQSTVWKEKKSEYNVFPNL